ATFLSLTGYSIPVMAAILGFFLFGETQSWLAMLAFAMILGGVWLARRGGGVRS
ncbi:MAG: EamA family transporter, partial [Hyphomonas sp.]|nr:EamA family transporter [Hyphomonas sp.]